jgi:hypothetical protein
MDGTGSKELSRLLLTIGVIWRRGCFSTIGGLSRRTQIPISALSARWLPGAAAFFERPDYLSANAVYPERNFPFRRVFDIFGNMFAMKSRLLSTHW